MRGAVATRLVFVFAAAAAILVPAGAAAAPAIVKGGPKADRPRVDAALTAAQMAMGVCWRGSPPAKVNVKITVAAGGAVTATAVTKGGAAQCAAGVLAVWTLPGGAWSGELEITAGSSPADLAATIQTQLLAQSGPIKACQSQAPTASGPVAIKMKIQPDGAITDVVVSSSLGAKIDGCVQKAVGAIRIEPTGSTAGITYQLAVAFTGKAAEGDGGPVGPSGGGDPDGGTIAGGLPVDDVRPVLTGARPKLIACGRKGSKKGKVVTRFTIRPDGTTKNVVIKESIGDKGIEDCLIGVFKALTFPTGTGETKVSYPTAYN